MIKENEVEMARVEASLAAQFEREIYDKTVAEVEKNSEIIDEVVNELVNRYCKELDELIDNVNETLETYGDIEKFELDIFIIKLPLQLYYISEAQESLGIKEDTAKAIRQVLFNQARDKAVGTIADKDATAERAVEQETLASIAFSRASKKMKHRVEAALELLNSLKKVVSRRMSEADIARFSKDDNPF